jgi:hypothetical protein
MSLARGGVGSRNVRTEHANRIVECRQPIPTLLQVICLVSISKSRPRSRTNRHLDMLVGAMIPLAATFCNQASDGMRYDKMM